MKYSEFAKASPQTKPEGVVIDGTFGCQRCQEQANEAEWFVNEKILQWSCPDGHLSYIEDFVL